MKYYLNFLITAILTGATFVFIPGSLQAQMFSIDDDKPDRPQGINLFSMIGASWEPAVFEYTGDEASDLERLDFEASVFRFRFDSPGLNLSLAFGGSLTGMDDNSYLNLSGRLYNRFPLLRSQRFMLLVPLQISSDMKQVRKNQSDADFLQSSLVLGTGLSTLFNLGDSVSFNIKATPNYGFSFSQGSLFGGNLFRFDGKGLIYIHNVFGSNALTLGYYFDYRSYQIEGDLNDYDYTAHSITIGYAF